MQNFDPDRKRAASDLAERLFFELDKHGINSRSAARLGTCVYRKPHPEALSDKARRCCEGCWSEAFRLRADATRPGRQNGSV